jgi:hypothetical protein
MSNQQVSIIRSFMPAKADIQQHGLDAGFRRYENSIRTAYRLELYSEHVTK